MKIYRICQLVNPNQKHIDLINGILDGSYNGFNSQEANYDAEFTNGQMPYFLMIHSSVKGLGYILFHDFLNRVGSGNEFISTDFTSSGKSLFDKATKDGLIQNLGVEQAIGNITKWKVVGDPMYHLKSMLPQLNTLNNASNA